ncbi:MAG: hypothetical protein ACRD3E_03470 [Terriglobales bacterium]
MNAKKKGWAHFATTLKAGVPNGRNGKHKEVVTAILRDLATLEGGRALKIPLADLPDSKVNIRSALNRATRKAGLNVSTAADDDFLYVWNV